MRFDILAFSLATNVVLILVIGYITLHIQKIKDDLSDVVSDMTHEVVSNVVCILRTAVCVSKTRNGDWEATGGGLTTRGATPINAVINLLNEWKVKGSKE